jgi:hypothetical protein
VFFEVFLQLSVGPGCKKTTLFRKQRRQKKQKENDYTYGLRSIDSEDFGPYSEHFEPEYQIQKFLNQQY